MQWWKWVQIAMYWGLVSAVGGDVLAREAAVVSSRGKSRAQARTEEESRGKRWHCSD